MAGAHMSFRALGWPQAWRRFSVTPAALCWLAGVAVQLQQARLWTGVSYASSAGAALLLALLWLRRRHLPAPWLYLALAVLGWSLTGLRAVQVASQALDRNLQGRDLVVVGRVVGLPQWGEDGTRLALQVESALQEGTAVQLPPRLALGWYRLRSWRGREVQPEGAAPVSEELASAPSEPCRMCVMPGEQWRMTVRLKQPHGNRNPWAFDSELWMWDQGLGATGYVRGGRSGAPAERLADARPLDAAAWIDRARVAVRTRIYQVVAPGVVPWEQGRAAAAPPAGGGAGRARVAGVLAALVMGDQSAIDRDDWDIFRITGVAHLMSISGLHITMFAWLASGLVGWGWRRTARWKWPLCLAIPAPRAALWGGVLLAWLYALFSGWGVPAQRTVCMLVVLAVLRSGGRQWPWPALWAVAAAAVVAWDPWALLQAGFWLSFVAVGILFAAGQEQTAPADGWRARIMHTLAGFGREQMLVLAALTPLTLMIFGQVSLVGTLANLVAVPVVTLLVTPLAMLGALCSPLWLAAAWCVQQLMALLGWLASWPWAQYQAAQAPWWAGVLGVAGGVLLCMRGPWPLRWPGALMMVPVLAWQAPRPDAGEFEVLMTDIGQGSALVVRTARHTLLYDAGPRYGAHSNAGDRVLLPLFHALDETPDVAVLSHSDTDHIAGIEPLLQAYPHLPLLGSIAPDHPLQQLRAVEPCSVGQDWQWEGVDFRFLHPLETDYVPQAKTNAMSCVLRVSNGRRTVLLTGDAEAPQEAAMLARTPPEWLRADVLVAGHHGSKTSSSQPWLQAVAPHWTLIQHGYRNTYHHPHPQVLARLHSVGTIVVQTDQCGAGWWSSATNAIRCEREVHRHYWQHEVPTLP